MFAKKGGKMEIKNQSHYFAATSLGTYYVLYYCIAHSALARAFMSRCVSVSVFWLCGVFAQQIIKSHYLHNIPYDYIYKFVYFRASERSRCVLSFCSACFFIYTFFLYFFVWHSVVDVRLVC